MKILVIRTDKIGDLICTTPALRALREHYPEATIVALANSYNQSALENNPDINELCVYTRIKHRKNSLLSNLLENVALIAKLRRYRFDYVILLGGKFRAKEMKLARLCKSKHIIGYAPNTRYKYWNIDVRIPYDTAELHEVEQIFRLLEPLGIKGKPPALRLVPSANQLTKAQRQYSEQFPNYQGVAPIAVHIGAAVPERRWPTASYIELIENLWERYQLPIMLFWAPGNKASAFHPGDDAEAKQIMTELRGIPLVPYPTKSLDELIGAMSIIRSLICSDGGAMHIAAALGKPIVAFFTVGESRWYPWGVPHQLVRCDLNQVVPKTLAAYEKLGLHHKESQAT